MGGIMDPGSHPPAALMHNLIAGLSTTKLTILLVVLGDKVGNSNQYNYNGS